MKQRLITLARQLLPVTARRQIVRFTRWPPVGFVWWGSLGRVRPISTEWGSDRGQPIDRFYIAQFLASHAGDIRGHVLEIGTDRYTRTFGEGRVTRCDVLHVAEMRPPVTLLGDLTDAPPHCRKFIRLCDSDANIERRI